MEEKAAYSNQKLEVGGERLEELTGKSLLLIPRTVESKACVRILSDSKNRVTGRSVIPCPGERSADARM